MRFRLTDSGSFKNSEKYLKAIQQLRFLDILDRWGEIGTGELAAATPEDTGKTAGGWAHRVILGNSTAQLIFINDSVNKGFHIAIGLQYGHGTGTGGYVQGRDYINPAIQPIFDKILEGVTKEIRGL